MKLLEENKGEYLHDLRVIKDFLGHKKALAVKILLNWTTIKLRTSVLQKILLREQKGKSQKRRRYLQFIHT